MQNKSRDASKIRAHGGPLEGDPRGDKTVRQSQVSVTAGLC